MGTTDGYKLYSLSSHDNLENIYECRKYDWHDNTKNSIDYHFRNSTISLDHEEIHLAERLFTSSLVAVVHKSDLKTLEIWHFKKGTRIVKYEYESRILSVKMNRAVSTTSKT